MAERRNLWHKTFSQSNERGEPCLKYEVLPDFERGNIEPAIGGRSGKNSFELKFKCKQIECDFGCTYFFEIVDGIVERIQRVDGEECSRDRFIEDNSS
jgi:hypothetical protein